MGLFAGWKKGLCMGSGPKPRERKKERERERETLCVCGWVCKERQKAGNGECQCYCHCQCQCQGQCQCALRPGTSWHSLRAAGSKRCVFITRPCTQKPVIASTPQFLDTPSNFKGRCGRECWATPPHSPDAWVEKMAQKFEGSQTLKPETIS